METLWLLVDDIDSSLRCNECTQGLLVQFGAGN